MSDWVSALIGVSGTLAGGGLALWSTTRQAKVNAAREEVARSWEHRRVVYLAFLEAIHELHEARHFAYTEGETERSEAALTALLQRRWEVEMFGGGAVKRSAEQVCSAAIENADRHPQIPAVLTQAFTGHARKDLKVPD